MNFILKKMADGDFACSPSISDLEEKRLMRQNLEFHYSMHHFESLWHKTAISAALMPS